MDSELKVAPPTPAHKRRTKLVSGLTGQTCKYRSSSGHEYVFGGLEAFLRGVSLTTTTNVPCDPLSPLRPS